MIRKRENNLLKKITEIFMVVIFVMSFSILTLAATMPTNLDYYTYPLSDYYPTTSTDIETYLKPLSMNSAADIDVPIPTDVTLNADGEVTWNIYDINPWSGNGYIYKKFEVQLLKRQWVEESTSGGVVTPAHYEYKASGGAKSFNISSENEDDYFANMAISTPGYYIVRVRAYTYEGRYSCWGWQMADDAAAFDSNTTNISVTNGAQAQYVYGPGTQNYTGQTYNSMQVQQPFINQGYQYNPYYYYGGNYMQNGNVYDPNLANQYVYQNGQQIPYQNYNQNNQASTQANVGVGPGYASTGANLNQAGPGIIQNSQYPSLNGGAPAGAPGIGQYGNTTQMVTTSPGQSGSNAGSNGQVFNPSGFSTEVGWHSDTIGIYYYLGNGTYLRDQWYLIDGAYYRFNSNGYIIVNQWFKDPSNSGWYYLGGDAKMATGWIKWEGKWYYLNPQKGTYYGVMYANCSLPIDGKYYAFNDQGECVMNAQYGGYYYGADGSRQG